MSITNPTIVQGEQGESPAGSAPVGNPVLVGGTDGSLVRTLKTDATGSQVMGPATALGTGIDLWNNVAVGVGGKSAGIGVFSMRTWMIVGVSNGATTLTVEVSTDFAQWRAALTPAPVVLAGAGDFNIDCRALYGVPYVRLSSSAAATITAGAVGNY